MRKLIFKSGIQRIFCAFFQTLISWSEKHELVKYYSISLRKNYEFKNTFRI